MEPILIYKSPEVFEPINDATTVSVIKKAEHKKVLMGEDVISMTVESAMVRNFAIGDYIQLPGMPKYKLNQMPTVSKNSERKYQYDLSFEGLQYDLLRAVYRNTDVTSFNNNSDFSLMGNIEMFLNVLINNLTRVYGTGSWVLGSFPEATLAKNLIFSNENCLVVLQRLCEEYQQQFSFEQTETHCKLNIRKVGSELDFSFKYGHGKGLYKLARENVDSKNLVNTLWAYGSEKNLPIDYKGYSPRLRLSAEEDLPTVEAESKETFGTFEGSVIFEEIFPRRTGTVSAINEANRLEFVDESMDFDLNETDTNGTVYKIAGTDPKIVFQSGGLSGYEFELSGYDHSTKKFSIRKNKEQKGLELPSADEPAFQIAVGDTYVLVDLKMPQTYITAAEDELEAKALEYLRQYSFPTVKYTLELDDVFVKNKATSLHVFEVGDTVKIEDEALLINGRIKIADFTRDILNPYKYQLTIQDAPITNVLRRFIVQDRQMKEVVKIIRLNDPVRVSNDKTSDGQIQKEMPKYLDERRTVSIGKGSETVTIGNEGSANKFVGESSFRGTGLGTAHLNVDYITAAREIILPDDDIVVNNWNFLSDVPESFPSLTTDYGLLGIRDGINKVYTTSSEFVEFSTFMYINGVRQVRGLSADYAETGPNEITFTLPPQSDDVLTIDYQKL